MDGWEKPLRPKRWRPYFGMTLNYCVCWMLRYLFPSIYKLPQL